MKRSARIFARRLCGAKVYERFLDITASKWPTNDRFLVVSIRSTLAKHGQNAQGRHTYGASVSLVIFEQEGGLGAWLVWPRDPEPRRTQSGIMDSSSRARRESFLLQTLRKTDTA